MIYLIALFSLIINIILAVSLIVIKDWRPLGILIVATVFATIYVCGEIGKKMDEKEGE